MVFREVKTVAFSRGNDSTGTARCFSILAVDRLSMADTNSAELPLEGLEAMPLLPRCEETGQNADLHLVVFTPPEGNQPVARIWTTQVRHLHRSTTVLSVPLWMLTLDNLAKLEQRGAVPRRSRAAETIREWLRYDREATWKELFRAEQACQTELALRDEPTLDFGD